MKITAIGIDVGNPLTIGQDKVNEAIVELLWAIKEPDDEMEELIACMKDGGFFEAPCSGGNHLAVRGGLARHSLNVYMTMAELNVNLHGGATFRDVGLCSLLHDLGKMGDHGIPNYVPNFLKSGAISDAKPFRTNEALPYIDHEVRSLMIAKQFIQLTAEQEQAILYHNGLYGSFKYQIPGKETPLYLLLHFADMWASHVTEVHK
nr:MAG TPA: putative HD superfamily hydrolase [Caudoviricetes sp.]